MLCQSTMSALLRDPYCRTLRIPHWNVPRWDLSVDRTSIYEATKLCGNCWALPCAKQSPAVQLGSPSSTSLQSSPRQALKKILTNKNRSLSSTGLHVQCVSYIAPYHTWRSLARPVTAELGASASRCLPALLFDDCCSSCEHRS